MAKAAAVAVTELKPTTEMSDEELRGVFGRVVRQSWYSLIRDKELKTRLQELGDELIKREPGLLREEPYVRSHPYPVRRL